MTAKLLAPAFFQVAWVVRDIATAERFFIDTTGIKKFFHFENMRAADVEGTYRGKPGDWVCHLYFAYAGDTQIELIQHVSGTSIFNEFLNQHGDAVQHVGYCVDDADWDAAAHRLESAGYPLVQGLRTQLGRAGYFDTRRAVGVATEIVSVNEAGREFFRNLKTGNF
ncbi:MAG: VOC family protein [Candidatus Latescibacteria bacterium]|nr:VOC family protein [Candidatus Latescibacterota bacterium]